MATNKNDINTIIDIEKLTRDIKQDLAREHNWDAQEKHWENQDKQWDIQKTHWLQQQKYWRWVFLLGFVAVLVNGFKSLWS